MGRPNTGKSTLLNAILKQKVAAVSRRPQMTRKRQLGILTLDKAQIVFIDTPGMHIPNHKLGEYMNEEARTALEDADLVVFVVDSSQPPGEEDRLLAAELKNLKHEIPIILALNKMDLVSPSDLVERQRTYQELIPQAIPQAFSAISGRQLDLFLSAVVDRLPTGQPFFDEEQITDYYEREIAADLVREAAMNHLREEVPHAITVRVDEFTERKDGNAYIAATLFVERESQKGIAIGQGGVMLKKIGSSARKEIESMSGRKIYLDLHVKVQKNWRNNPDILRQLGYRRKEEE